MTYAVGLKMDRGLVFMSDTRTNAGLDNIASFGKSVRGSPKATAWWCSCPPAISPRLRPSEA